MVRHVYKGPWLDPPYRVVLAHLQLGAFKRSIDLERSMKYPFGNNDPLIEDEAEPPDTTKEDDHLLKKKSP